jgi:hypothetical protein
MIPGKKFLANAKPFKKDKKAAFIAALHLTWGSGPSPPIKSPVTSLVVNRIPNDVINDKPQNIPPTDELHISLRCIVLIE